MGQTTCRGFTLVELIVVVAIVAILLTVAVPSFVSLTQRNRVAAEVNSLVGDLQYARAEAIKQGIPVSLCASSDGASCLGTSAWQQGWIVFSDAAGSGNIVATVQPLRKRQGLTNGDTFVPSPSVSAITYSRDGFATNLTSGTVTFVLHTAPVNSAATRCVAVNTVGRQLVQSPGTGGCT